jgi:hypothetical protein
LKLSITFSLNTTPLIAFCPPEWEHVVKEKQGTRRRLQLEQVELVLRQRWNPSEIANRERPAGQEVSLVRPGLETPRAAKRANALHVR